MAKKLLGVCVCLCVALCAPAAHGQDKQLVATARKTLQTYEKSVILLQAVLKMEIKGHDSVGREGKTQCLATIIDPTGLAVTALMNLNPKARSSRSGLEIDYQVQEVKYRLSDGTEVPARMVLKDEDLDLAFLAPQKPLDAATRAKIASIPLADAATGGETLDGTILIGRTDESTNYIATLNVGQIEAVLAKPRACYMNNKGTLGTPVFYQNGKILGFICQCVNTESDEGSQINKARSLLGIGNVYVLPAADVVKLLPQVREEIKKLDAEKKPEAEKKTTPEKKPGTATKTEAPKKAEK
jgi:hypothetical protein